MAIATRKGPIVMCLLVMSITSATALVQRSTQSTTAASSSRSQIDALKLHKLALQMAEEYETRELEFGLFRLNDKQLADFGIVQVDSGDGPDWAVAWSKVTDNDTGAISETLGKVNIPCFGSCSHGYAGWYVARKHFFAARRALLDSPEVKSLGVKVVTPRFN